MSPSHRLVPAPPRPIDPLIHTWPAGQPCYRVHDRRFRAGQFNPGPLPRTRFAFFADPPVPVLYAGGAPEAAVAESVFHDVPITGGRVSGAAVRNRVLSTLEPVRDLRLAQFHSGGLLRPGIKPRNLTDTEADHYPRTVAWAHAVHNDTDLDGITWMSRRRNGSPALVLFGDRVDEHTLTINDSLARSFIHPDHFEWLAALGQQVNIQVMPPW